MKKRVHYNDLFAKIGKNSKLLWNTINCLVKKCNNKTEFVKIVPDDTGISDWSEICNAFNEHFTSASRSVQESIQKSTCQKNVCDYVKKVKRQLSFRCVTESEICRIVTKMKSKTSCGFDEISNQLLKKLVNVIKGPLCVIFNKSL